MSFPGTVYGNLNDRLNTTSNQVSPLGTRMILPDGRVFRYAKAGGVALGIGQLMQEAVVTSGHTKDLLVAVKAAIGATSVTVTNATTPITANMYAEGYLFVNNEDGEGQICTIKSHPAESTGTGSCVITLEDEDALTVALTTSSRVGLRKNLYKDVVVSAQAAVTAPPVGVTPCAVADEDYFWLQTWGPAGVLTNGVVVLGKTVYPSVTTNGAVDPYLTNATAAAGLEPVVGWVMSVAASTEYSLIYLTLAP